MMRTPCPLGTQLKYKFQGKLFSQLFVCNFSGFHITSLISGCSDEVEYFTVDSPKINPGDSLKFGGGKADLSWILMDSISNPSGCSTDPVIFAVLTSFIIEFEMASLVTSPLAGSK